MEAEATTRPIGEPLQQVLSLESGKVVASSQKIVSERTFSGADEGTEESPLLGRISDGQPGVTRDDGDEDEDARWDGDIDFEGLSWWKSPSIYWLIAPFFLYTLAFGGVVVPKINLILVLICRPYLSAQRGMTPGAGDPLNPQVPSFDESHCQKIPEVQALVANFTLYLNLLSGILAAITSPMLGTLSDRYGRKTLLALTSLGTLIGEIIFVFAALYPETVSVNWILVGSALDGLFGSFIAAMAISFAYVSDCYSPKDRNVKFGYLYGCLFAGIAFGPVVSGYIVKATGQLLTMLYVALACHTGFIAFLLLCTPESLSKRRQNIAREKHKIYKSERGTVSWLQTIKKFNLFAPLKILFPTGPGTSNALRANLVLLSSVDAIMFGVAMGSMTILMLYAEYEFDWTNLDTSIYVSVVNSGRVFGLLVLLPTVTRLYRGRSSSRPQQSKGSDNFDLYLIRAAVFFDTLGYVGYTLVRRGALFTLSGLVASIGALGAPAISSALTKHVPADRTGQLLGAMGLLHSLGRVVAPTIFHTIYSHTVGKFDQTVFVCLCSTFGCAFFLTWFIRPHVYFDEPDLLSEQDGGRASVDA